MHIYIYLQDNFDSDALCTVFTFMSIDRKDKSQYYMSCQVVLNVKFVDNSNICSTVKNGQQVVQ